MSVDLRYQNLVGIGIMLWANDLVPTCTVAVFNSCTKLAGCPGIVHNHTSDCPDCYLGMDACVTSRLNVALFHKLCVSFMFFAYFF